MTKRVLATLATLSALSLTLAGCGSTSLSGGNPAPAGASTSSAPAQADAALAAKLPEKIKSSKKIVVGTDASYAPNEFLDADGKTVVGADVDVFNAVAAKFGVTVEWQPSSFDSIITGVQGKKYDIGVSSFTINAKRMEQVNMVSYYSAGTQWATAKGNPKQVSADNACGKTIAVQTGTVQDEEDLPKRQEKCGANKINVLQYEGQDQATAAVVSGKADAMLADSPVVAYAAKQSQGKLETLGDIYDAAPYGIVVPKDQTEFANAIAEALKAAKADGSYEKALQKWGTEKGKIDNFQVNPAS
ncbi:ABC transporter substrate-binding protein [Enemella dayhoffiae]|uniref:ABC transporter substrate-binding protein n=1 Tax=Enemella dayhoffiae TaxID=2016507 RepID=A0A255H063_9ACTN|nr:ABC transporter substrate-binding protein [Enemella dayhoffiae]OYO19344.1 ABC transporter substrate-binding protein [Enemella dayhoffiae]